MASNRQKPASESVERRDEVLRATWRVIARDGLEKASLRAIAQELDSTTGVLTHYFRDKDALLDFVLVSIADGLKENWDPVLTRDPTVKRVIDHIATTLPYDARKLDSWKVWLSFTVAAFVRRRHAMDHVSFYSALRKKWTIVLRELQRKGEVRADLNPEIEAELLLCLFDGIGVQSVISPKHLTAKRQQALIEAYFEKLKA